MSNNSLTTSVRLREIADAFDMNPGAPMPVVLSDESEVHVVFYGNSENDDCIAVTFHDYYQYLFGGPNDETLAGHRYYELGLESYGFFEVENSEWIEELKKIDHVHEYHDEERWKKMKHFIITFHDSMFECVAESFAVEKSREKRTEIIERIAKQLV